ncbi:hypothetical protein FKM82_027589 [Ascaphus truei]
MAQGGAGPYFVRSLITVIVTHSAAHGPAIKVQSHLRIHKLFVWYKKILLPVFPCWSHLVLLKPPAVFYIPEILRQRKCKCVVIPVTCTSLRGSPAPNKQGGLRTLGAICDIYKRSVRWCSKNLVPRDPQRDAQEVSLMKGQRPQRDAQEVSVMKGQTPVRCTGG